MRTPQEEITAIGRMMFERRLAPIAGGNISVRDGGQFHITPRYAGARWHWNLDPEDIVTGLMESDDFVDDPRFSRETWAHVSIYRAFPEARAVIHSHPFHVVPFCVAGRPIEPATHQTSMLGTIDFIDCDDADDKKGVAESVVRAMRGKEKLMSEWAVPVLMRRHGIMLAGADLYTTLEVLCRIETNAWSILAQKLL